MFTGRGNAIVTGATATEHLCVIDGVCWRKTDRIVAVLANIGGLNMRGVLARRIGTVVTAHAIAGDIHMIEVGGRPSCGRMAVVAVDAANDMVGVLAGGDNAVMAGAASTQHGTVINGEYRGESVSRMTVLAGVGRQDVSRVLPNCIYAIVAGDTIARDIRMIKDGRCPGRRVVAVVALLAGRYVRRRLAGSLHAVVTVVATAGYGRMVHESY